MARTIYAQVQFVALHQKNPGFDVGSNAGNPLLDVNGYTIPVHKYSLEFGFGDPGENPAFDNFDYPEFSIQTVIADPPSDLNERGTYEKEALNGGTSTSSYKKWWSITVPDDFVIPAQYDKGSLADGWSAPDHTGATSGDFAWSGTASAIYNRVTNLSSSQVVDAIDHGLLLGAQQIISWAASTAGVKGIWDAAKRDARVATALTDFVKDGTNTLTQLMNGFNTGMTAAQADALLTKFMDESAFRFHQTTEAILGTGAGSIAKAIINSIRFAERWAVDPSTGAITHSEVGVESGTQTAYLGHGNAGFPGTPQLHNDVVLDGDAPSFIDTGVDIGITARAQIDFIAAGGGSDLILAHEGADVIAAGSGSDRVDAGPGNDYINGGSGYDRSIYSGSISSYTITHNSNGSIQVVDNRPGSPDGSDTLASVEQLVFSNGTVTLTARTQDYGRDGVSDLLFHNSSGNAAIYNMHADGSSNAILLGTIDPSWKIEDTGRYGDGSDGDILWRNASTGQTVYWSITAGQKTPGYIDLGTLGSQWQIQTHNGSSDFTGDGADDILWRNTSTNQLVYWNMQGGHAVSTVVLGTGPSSQWDISGTGDFNGDDKADILWHNNVTGQAFIWASGGSGPTSELGVINPTWQPAGIGDFKGDGVNDLLWFNTASHQAVYWDNTPYGTSTTVDLGITPSGFTFDNPRDLTGDGTDDFILHNSNNGLIVSATNDGGTVHAFHVIDTLPTSWHLI